MAKIDENVKVMMLKGETGSNIKSIDKTATSGLVDTYTVTLTDGTKSNFNVTNGKDGKDGADFDTFEIGGRNLLRGSRDFSGSDTRSSIATYSTETVSGADCKVMSVDNSASTSPFEVVVEWRISGIGTAGAVYTASFWFKGSGDCFMFFHGPSGYTNVYSSVMTINGTTTQFTGPDGEVIFNASGSTVSEWTRCTVVYTLSGTVGSTTDKNLLIRISRGATLSIALPKLERSTKPSDWTPAPEDKADVSALAGKADVSAIVPKASVESSATASQAYSAGQYVVVNGILRKVKSAIAKGNTISDSNSTATTVTGEFASFARVEAKDSVHKIEASDLECSYVKRNGIVYLAIGFIQGHADVETEISVKMPEGYRPISGFEPYFVIGHESNGGSSGMCRIHSDGTISTISKNNGIYYAGVVSYPAE